jgi:hypothetical protein
MQPSRRGLLATMGATTVASVSGCTASGVLRTDEAENHPTGTDTDTTFEAQLSGPETDQRLFDNADITKVGEVGQQNGSFILPITLTENARSSISETFHTAGVRDNTDAFEIVLVSDDEEINRFGITPGLAESIAEGEWDGEFVLIFNDREEAEEIRDTLTAE